MSVRVYSMQELESERVWVSITLCVHERHPSKHLTNNVMQEVAKHLMKKAFYKC